MSGPTAGAHSAPQAASQAQIQPGQAGGADDSLLIE